MKKIFVSTLLLLALVIAGCGQGDSEGTDDSTSQDDQEETEQNDSDQSQTDGEESQDNSGSDSNSDEPNNEPDETENDTVSIDKDQAQEVLTEYEYTFNKVIENTEDNGKLKEYTSKEELSEHFQEYMSEQWATSMIDTYFEEREDGMYVKAMDAPMFLQSEEEFSFNHTEDEKAKVTQERNNELTGHIKIEFELIHESGEWIVNKVDIQNLNENNEG